jgi:hypothetical protein
VPRKSIAARKLPTILSENAFQALSEQLESLQKLKNRRYDEAKAETTLWEHLTESLIEAAFDNPSTSLDRFHTATHAGPYFPGMGASEYQSNFDTRIREYDALLRSLVKVLQLQLPKEEIKGVYEPGDQYGFYRDLSSIVASVTAEIFIVDVYLDENIFNLYVAKVPAIAPVRILTNKIRTNVETVAKMYAKSRPLELRSSSEVHDRTVFLDQRGWVIGQSIKDAARKKPTYLIELDEPLLTVARDIYNRIWAAAKIVNLV